MFKLSNRVLSFIWSNAFSYSVRYSFLYFPSKKNIMGRDVDWKIRYCPSISQQRKYRGLKDAGWEKNVKRKISWIPSIETEASKDLQTFKEGIN